MRKRASLRPAPAAFPILGPYRAPLRTFPGHMLDNKHCIATYGYGLAAMAKRGGLHVCEVAKNLHKLPHDAPMSQEQAERIIEQATGSQHERTTTPAHVERAIRTEMVQRPLWR